MPPSTPEAPLRRATRLQAPANTLSTPPRTTHAPPSLRVASEEPLINGRFGVGYTQGVQTGSDPNHLKTVVTLKHWDAYS